MKRGFLGIVAPPYASLTLLLEMAMGVGLLLGALLARRRRFQGHAWCQSVIVLLNLAVIVLTMIPSFRVHVSPKIPIKLGNAYYATSETLIAFVTPMIVVSAISVAVMVWLPADSSIAVNVPVPATSVEVFGKSARPSELEKLTVPE